MLSFLARRSLSTASANTSQKLSDQILEKLKAKYKIHLIHADVKNIGWQHGKSKDAETHLGVTIVCTEFETVPLKKRLASIKELLADELRKTEYVEYDLLIPSRWFNSPKRGLKLPTQYSNPPILNGQLENIVKGFYSKEQPEKLLDKN